MSISLEWTSATSMPFCRVRNFHRGNFRFSRDFWHHNPAPSRSTVLPLSLHDLGHFPSSKLPAFLADALSWICILLFLGLPSHYVKKLDQISGTIAQSSGGILNLAVAQRAERGDNFRIFDFLVENRDLNPAYQQVIDRIIGDLLEEWRTVNFVSALLIS